MVLRVDAPVFVPSFVATVPSATGRAPGVRMAKGDLLIQKLANALEPSAPLMPDTISSMLPAAGVFCPYCIAKCAACAFHKPVRPEPAHTVPPGLTHPAQWVTPQLGKMALLADSAAGLDIIALLHAEDTAASCLAFVDPLSDSEQASTDVGSSEAWCGAASDTSDRSAKLAGDGAISGNFTTREYQQEAEHCRSLNHMHQRNNGRWSCGTGRWGAPAHGLPRILQRNPHSHAR